MDWTDSLNVRYRSSQKLIGLQDEEPALSWVTTALRSSVGKKFVMGATGLFLCLFLVIHLAGNLLLFVGPEAYNEYALKLHSMKGPLLVSQVFLYAALASHIYLAIVTWRENRTARGGGKYAIKQTKKEGLNAPHAIAPENTMFISGALILAYLIFLHLPDFKFGITGAPETMEPFARAKLLLGCLWRTIAYAAAGLIVGHHVSHGLASALQSLGVNHPKYNSCIKKTSIAFSIIVAAGFAAVAIYMFMLE